MPNTQQHALRYDIIQVEQHLRQAEELNGPDSVEFKAAQRKLLRLWAMLKMTHPKDAFLQEITR